MLNSPLHSCPARHKCAQTWNLPGSNPDNAFPPLKLKPVNFLNNIPQKVKFGKESKIGQHHESSYSFLRGHTTLSLNIGWTTLKPCECIQPFIILQGSLTNQVGCGSKDIHPYDIHDSKSSVYFLNLKLFSDYYGRSCLSQLIRTWKVGVQLRGIYLAHLAHSSKSPHSSPLGDLMTLLSEKNIMSEKLSWVKWVWYFLTSLFTRFCGANISQEDCSCPYFHSVKKDSFLAELLLLDFFRLESVGGQRFFYKRSICCS